MKRSVEELRSQMTMERTAGLATKFLEGSPADWNNSRLGQSLKIIWTGLVWENTIEDQRQLSSIAKYCNSPAHSSVFEWRRRWFELGWRERHGYLVLFEEGVAAVLRVLADIHAEQLETRDDPTKVGWCPEYGWLNVTDSVFGRWIDKYPSVRVRVELAAAHEWLLDNPSKEVEGGGF